MELIKLSDRRHINLDSIHEIIDCRPDHIEIAYLTGRRQALYSAEADRFAIAVGLPASETPKPQASRKAKINANRRSVNKLEVA